MVSWGQCSMENLKVLSSSKWDLRVWSEVEASALRGGTHARDTYKCKKKTYYDLWNILMIRRNAFFPTDASQYLPTIYPWRFITEQTTTDKYSINDRWFNVMRTYSRIPPGISIRVLQSHSFALPCNLSWILVDNFPSSTGSHAHFPPQSFLGNDLDLAKL